MKISREPLGKEYKIWIPVDAMSEQIHSLLLQLTTLVGGMTEVHATGVWVGEDVIEEDVHILQFITNEFVLDHIYELAQTLIEEGQEAVLAYFHNEHYILKGEVAEANPEIKFNWRRDE